MAKSNVDHLVSLIFATKRLIMENIKDSEKIDPFSFLRLEVLRFIKEKVNPTMKDIANYLCITPPSATSLINALVKKGLVRRVRDKKDRRMIRLEVTDKGEKHLKKEFERITRKIKKIYTRLSDKEIKELIKILKKFSKEYKK